MFEIFIEIKRQKLIGKLIVEQFLVEDTALSDKVTQSNVAVTGQIINVRNTRTAGLTAHITHAVTGSCRNRHNVFEV